MLAVVLVRGIAFVEDIVVNHAFKKVLPAEIVVELRDDQPNGDDEQKLAEKYPG
jgi:hypothetical protein